MPNKSVSVTIEKEYVQNTLDGRLYSSFVEHLGRCVYTGIYEPGHPKADADGFRTDVLDLVKDLGVELVRYPGGNFLSGYRWQDGIGPKADRPRRLDLAWRTVESNEFGIDEFAKWAKKSGTEMMAAVNMGTGTPLDAGDMVEYCNFPGGTYLSDLRIKNGAKEPYGIKTWCVGNEMDGPWQTCHLDANDYGKKALEAIKIMKWVDPSLEAVVCGSASSKMPTFPEWDRIVLEHTYDHADYLSLHMYYQNNGNDLDFLASFLNMDNFINSVAATADYVKALKRSNKKMYFSFDEWNVWYQSAVKLKDWEEAPEILEDRYSLLDALVFGGLGITLINRSDRVKIACLAQLVNVIAPIFTKKNGAAIKQTIYHPFRMISKYGRGKVLSPVVRSGKVETVYGDAPMLHTAVVHDEENGELNIFCLNITKEDIELKLDTRSFGNVSFIEHFTLCGTDLSAINTFDDPNKVAMGTQAAPANCDSIRIGALSWNVIRLKV